MKMRNVTNMLDEPYLNKTVDDIIRDCNRRRLIELVNDINDINQLMTHTPEGSMLYTELDELVKSLNLELLNRLKQRRGYCNVEDTKQ